MAASFCPDCGPKDGGIGIAKSKVNIRYRPVCGPSMVAWILPKVKHNLGFLRKGGNDVSVYSILFPEILSGSKGKDGMLWFCAKDRDTFCNVSCGILM